MRRQFTVPADACARSAVEARQNVLRDLHDGVGPSLAAVALGLRVARELLNTDPAKAQRILQQLEEETRSAIDDMRALTRDACPPALAERGLLRAITEFAATLETRILVTTTDLPGLPQEVQIAAYRIIREALTNVVVHAHATQASVHLKFDEVLHIEITDNGVGATTDQRGVGLSSMQKRAQDLGGSWLLESDETGTKIAAALPVQRT